MQILSLRPRPPQPETRGVGPSNICFNRPFWGVQSMLKLELHSPRAAINEKIAVNLSHTPHLSLLSQISLHHSLPCLALPIRYLNAQLQL